jgi:ribose 5-phosphate isomerase B
MTDDATLKAILDAWFSTSYSNDDWNLEQITRIDKLERTPPSNSDT